jgi:hypothetical protein
MKYTVKTPRQLLNELHVQHEMETELAQKCILKEQIEDIQFYILKHGENDIIEH